MIIMYNVIYTLYTLRTSTQQERFQPHLLSTPNLCLILLQRNSDQNSVACVCVERKYYSLQLYFLRRTRRGTRTRSLILDWNLIWKWRLCPTDWLKQKELMENWGLLFCVRMKQLSQVSGSYRHAWDQSWDHSE